MPTRRLPLWLKLAYSAFVAVLVPGYAVTYGLANFLFFCDVAAGLTLAGLWLESPLLLGSQAVGILVPQAVWVVDYATGFLGGPRFGLTDYMFDAAYPVWVRAVSLYHGWLPFLLLWAIRRLGYDRRSFRVQVLIGLAVLLACYLTTRPAQNINYVFGPSKGKPQRWTPPAAWLGVVMAVSVVGMFLPAHLLLRRVAPPPPKGRR